MSEYTCAEGHIVPHGKFICPTCGGRITREDGYSSKELQAIEDGFDRIDAELEDIEDEENEDE